MINFKSTFLLAFSLFLMGAPGFSQQTMRSISVTGKGEFNLSPNEIIIKIDYEEYFLNGSETAENKVVIEDIEKQVVKAVLAAGIKQEEISMGGVQVVRPYNKGVYQKRRLNKNLFVCVRNTTEYVDLIRSIETAELFDRGVVGFSISEYAHSEKESFLLQSREKAYQNAREKAELILSNSGNKLGQVVSIKEINNGGRVTFNPNTYEAVSSPTSTVSGFKNIVIAYELEVVFEIL